MNIPNFTRSLKFTISAFILLKSNVLLLLNIYFAANNCPLALFFALYTLPNAP